MRTSIAIPNGLMTENPNVVYLERCYDEYSGSYTGTSTAGTILLSPSITPSLPSDDYVMSFVSGQSIIERNFFVSVATPTALIVSGTGLPSGTAIPIVFYSIITPTVNPFDLVITETNTLASFTIRIEPAPNGSARLELQEFIKLLLLEPSAPNSSEGAYNGLYLYLYYRFKNTAVINQLIGFGSNVPFSELRETNNIYGKRRQAFKDLQKCVVSYPLTVMFHDTVSLTSLPAGDNEVEVTDGTAEFKLYNAVTCREPRYLSGYYGFNVNDVSGVNLIDVSTVVIAYMDQYGWYDYMRFSGNNAPFKAIQEATTVERIGSNLDVNTYTEYSTLNEIFEGIDLIAASDINSNYIIDNLEQQRILDALNTAKYLWLCVPANGNETKAIPIRVQRESVKYQGTFNNDPVIIQASILLNLPLRQIN
jgi:hypothetical protein